MASDRKQNEGLGQDPKMGEILRSGGAGSNAGEVDPGVDGDEITNSAGESVESNPDTDITGTFTEPGAGRDLGVTDINRGQSTGG